MWNPLPSAVLLDFDGLMVDTEWAIYQSWKRVYEKYSHPLPLDLFNKCLGSGYSHWDPGKHLEKLTNLTFDWETIHLQRQNEIEAELIEEGPMEGLLELLGACKKQNLPMGVVSSSSHRWVDGWLNRLELRNFFTIVVCRDNGFEVKPNPALYLEAARQLNVNPENCLVFEDSQNGITAAQKAGMRTVAIPNRVTQFAQFDHADFKRKSLLECLPK